MKRTIQIMFSPKTQTNLTKLLIFVIAFLTGICVSFVLSGCRLTAKEEEPKTAEYYWNKTLFIDKEGYVIKKFTDNNEHYYITHPKMVQAIIIK